MKGEYAGRQCKTKVPLYSTCYNFETIKPQLQFWKTNRKKKVREKIVLTKLRIRNRKFTHDPLVEHKKLLTFEKCIKETLSIEHI